MTSQGSPYGRFRRALDNGNALQARSAGLELGEIPLSDALELLLLIARKEPHLYGRAARALAQLLDGPFTRQAPSILIRWATRLIARPRSLDAVDKHVDTCRALAAPDPYWLARCEGWRVVTPAGRLGTVRRLLYAPRGDAPEALMIRVGFLRPHEILVDARTVEEIIPSEGKLLLNATPGDSDLPTVLRDRIPRRDTTQRNKPAA